MRNILLATHNPGKLAEFTQMMDGLANIQSLALFPEIQLPPETGQTYEENARLKAVFVASRLHEWSLADDSGLEVEALPGQLGVYSARYAQGSDADRVQHLLQALSGSDNRRATFVAVLVLVNPQTMESFSFRGELSGKIAQKPMGDQGFGYDPIFIPDGYERTFAQFTLSEKNRISHRAIALQKFREWLENHPELS